MTLTAEKMDDDYPVWTCRYCGKVSGFKLLGKGIIQCEQCHTRHILAPDGGLYIFEKHNKGGK